MRPLPDPRPLASACALLAAALAGCADPRDPPPRPTTWREDVAALLEQRCVRCHAGAAPAGAYALDTYLGALGTGTDDVPNAIAGDRSSLLLVKLGEPDHRAYLGEGETADRGLELLTSWVVDGRVGYFLSSVHFAGILNRDDAQFHGRKIAAAGWDMSSCRECHGEDYAGGWFDVSCLTCHPSTPESCSTCHGAGAPGDPAPALADGSAGAHAAHLAADPKVFPSMSCDACHAVPAELHAAGHLDTDGRADVALGEAASRRGARPAWEASTSVCSDVACHGAGLDGGTYPDRGWNDPPAAEGCDGCHGAPPARVASGGAHPQIARCEACHTATAGPNLTIRDPALHGDGLVDVRAGATGCDGCHTGPGGTLPFRDTAGDSDPSLQSVGAHTAHLEPGFFSDGFDCQACHAGRTAVDAPGHLDGSVQVVFGDPATARGSTPSWDPATVTCTEVACHGAGLDGGTVAASPAWTDASATPLCGDCHGIPPATLGSGAPHPLAATCDGCHGAVIDGTFHWVDRSLHANGNVEVTTP